MRSATSTDAALSSLAPNIVAAPRPGDPLPRTRRLASPRSPDGEFESAIGRVDLPPGYSLDAGARRALRTAFDERRAEAARSCGERNGTPPFDFARFVRLATDLGLVLGDYETWSEALESGVVTIAFVEKAVDELATLAAALKRTET